MPIVSHHVSQVDCVVQSLRDFSQDVDDMPVVGIKVVGGGGVLFGDEEVGGVVEVATEDGVGGQTKEQHSHKEGEDEGARGALRRGEVNLERGDRERRVSEGVG